MFPSRQTNHIYNLWCSVLLCLFVLCGGVQFASASSKDSTTFDTGSAHTSTHSQLATSKFSLSESLLWEAEEEPEEDQEEPEGSHPSIFQALSETTVLPHTTQLTQTPYVPHLLCYALFAQPPPARF